MSIINKTFTLEDLPSPPPDKSGWPWTEAIEPLPERMANGDEWPRISIVTPSYNYGQFIEETIRSVLLQGYPNLEYIVIDGNSTDNSVEIIKKYEKYLTYWIGEPDDGQTDAINKGYQRCTGKIFAWLNADDAYTPMTLHRVAENYLQGYELIAGSCLAIYSDGRQEMVDTVPNYFERFLRFWLVGTGFPQPSVFVVKDITDQCFPLDKSLYMLMDYQFFLRVLSYKPKSIYVKQNWVLFKFHGSNKSLSNYAGGNSEFFRVAFSESKKLPFIQRILYRIALKDYRVLHPILYSQTSPSLWQLISALISRPTLLHWPLFWKTWVKAILGKL